MLAGLWRMLGSGDDVIPSHKRADVAACAILLEVSRADDGTTSSPEQEVIASSLCELFGLSAEQAADIQARAVAVRAAHHDLSELARVVQRAWSLEEKRKVVEAIRRVIWADGKLVGHEQRVATAVASLLGLAAADVADRLRQEPPTSET